MPIARHQGSSFLEMRDSIRDSTLTETEARRFTVHFPRCRVEAERNLNLLVRLRLLTFLLKQLCLDAMGFGDIRIGRQSTLDRRKSIDILAMAQTELRLR